MLQLLIKNLIISALFHIFSVMEFCIGLVNPSMQAILKNELTLHVKFKNRLYKLKIPSRIIANLSVNLKRYSILKLCLIIRTNYHLEFLQKNEKTRLNKSDRKTQRIKWKKVFGN